MKRLVAIQAELIQVQPAADAPLRRRLLVERSGDVDRIPVLVTELGHRGCTIACPRRLSDLDGRLWLKMAGLEAFQVAAIDEAESDLVCLFAQPLSSVIFAALTRPTAQQVRSSAFRPRCAFLK